MPANALEVRARLSNKGGPEADVKVLVGRDETIKMLIKRIRQDAGVSAHWDELSGVPLLTVPW